jgi:outer membrane protein OmpA-like peptidoglycan-associated protein
MKAARLVPLFLLALAAPALAQTTPGWYVDAGVGANFTPDLVTSTASGDRTASFNTGYSALGGVGYAYGNGLRSEAEIFYSRAGVDHLSGAAGNAGSLSNTDFFVNGLYDINLSDLGLDRYISHSMWTPYVGLGIGASIPEAGQIGVLTNGSTFNDEDLQFAYQAIAGISAQLDRNWAVTADYRFIATPDVTFKTNAPGTGNMQNASHNIILGVRYSFGEPAPVLTHASAPAPYVKTAKKHTPAVVPQSYMVFFDFDKSVLTPEANDILAKVAADYKSGKYVAVDITGHTDTVGTEAYNKKLSVRRADAVKKALEALGVPATAIKAAGVGKKGLLVPTADGVREAQNRRAEVVFSSK